MLADTSIWVDYLRLGRAGAGNALDTLLERGEAVMCGPVVAELLAGASPLTQVELWPLLASLPWADLGRGHWRQVGETAAALRASGSTVALTDIEIAVAALAADARLWTGDSDFDLIASALPSLRRFHPLPTIS